VPTANAVVARAAGTMQRGAVYGASHSVNSISKAGGPVIAASLAVYWGVRSPFLAAGCLLGVSAAPVLLATRNIGGVERSKTS
jgi:MFS family permease